MKNSLLNKMKKRVIPYIAYKKYSKSCKDFQWKSIDEIKKTQTKKLTKIALVATKTVPFYKKKNLQINFDNFSLVELKKFPIVDKNIIRENFKDFFC